MSWMIGWVKVGDLSTFKQQTLLFQLDLYYIDGFTVDV